MIVYVATTGSNTTGDGTSSKPYKTITYAFSQIPKILNGFTASVVISEGTYNEYLIVSGYTGNLELLLDGNVTVSNGISVIGAYVTCRCVGNATYTLTVKGIKVANHGNLSSLSNVNVFTTGAQDISSSSASLQCTLSSLLYMTGIVTMAGNTDVGIFVTGSSEVHFGTIVGTGLNVGIYSSDGCKVSYRKINISANNVSVVGNSSIIVSPYGATIGTLSSDVTLYVATTGSDTTGNGTSSKPYKTITYAINSLPRDLGGYNANIVVSDGTYDEDVLFLGIGINGTFTISLSGNVTVNSIYSENSNIIIRSSDDTTTRTLSTKYVLITNASSFNVYASVYITTTGYYEDSGVRYSIFAVRQSSLYLSGNTTITGNTGTGVAISNTSKAYFYSIAGSGLAVGINVNTASHLTIYSNSLIATLPTAIYTGGQIIHNNGTQVSGMITSGLSCTWGTISGGYTRHGVFSGGVAMVTIQVVIINSIALSAGTEYLISGFPQPANDTGCTCSRPSLTANCYLRRANNSIVITPSSTIATGYGIAFNCTYLTNS
jgi:hypothetical protein